MLMACAINCSFINTLVTNRLDGTREGQGENVCFNNSLRYAVPSSIIFTFQMHGYKIGHFMFIYV